MIRVRKLVLAIAAATSLTSGMAHALGLGEISLQSSLSQPLNANIELLEVRDLDKSEIIPRLASPEDFSKAGVERDFFLSDLKFTPVIMPNGKSVLRVTSNKPVREPYLNFLVEVIWPTGRVLREYTLLLDPPMYSPETAVAAAPRLPVATPAPVAVPVSPARTQSKPVDGPFRVGSLPGSVSSTAAAPVRPQSSPAAASAQPLEGEYRTVKRDTLWEIAQRVKGGSSLNQTMLAIQDLNPDAFAAGNINRLKSGQVLRLPNAEQINSRSRAQANTAVAEQNTAWREGRNVAPEATRQLDATKRDAVGAAPAKVENTDSLRLVAADAGKSASASEKGSSADSKALADKLAVTQESLDTSRRQVDEMKGRVTELQTQLDKLAKLAELKDSQMAKLQADLAAQQKLAAEAAAKSAVVTPAVVPAPAPAAVEPAKPELTATPPVAPIEQAAPVGVAPEAPAAEPAAPVKDFNYSEDPATKVEPEVAKPAATPAPVPVEVVEPVQISTQPVVEEAPAPVSLVDELMANPLLLGAGGAGLLVLLLALMAISRRNALKNSDDAQVQSQAEDVVGDNTFAAEMDIPEDSFAGLDDLVEETAEAPVKAQTADALGEAEIYIAYGKFNQAAELLQNAINEEPQRTDLQLKLLEVMGELGDRDGFQRQQNDLQEIGGVSAQIDQVKAKYPAMAAASFAAVAAATAPADLGEFTLDDLEPEPALAVSDDLDNSFDLSLDDLDSDIGAEIQSPAPVAEENLDEFSLDFDLDTPAASTKSADDMDFDLSLDELGGEAGALETETSLKLDDDLSDFNLELESELSAAAADDAELSLNLDDDLAFDAPVISTPAELDSSLQAETEQVLTSDFDLSLADEHQLLEPIADEFDAQLDVVHSELDQLAASIEEPQEQLMPEPQLGAEDEDDFDFLSGTDETATKLDLARAYIDMGDAEGARDILDEVVAEGNEAQQQEARDLIGKLV